MTTCTYRKFREVILVNLKSNTSTVTLVYDQLTHTIPFFVVRLFLSSTCFEQHCAHHQEVKLY